MVFLKQILSQKVLEVALIKASCPKGVLFLLFFNDIDGRGCIRPQHFLGHNPCDRAERRRTLGSPSSLCRCVELDLKQFSKEVPVPAAGSSSADLRSFSPRFLPGPSVFTRGCQLPSVAILNCRHRGASLLPLVRTKKLPTVIRLRGKSV